MYLIPILTTLLTTLLSQIATADFLISNATLCHGVPTRCPPGAQLITPLDSNSNSNYNCDTLIPAQDKTYLRNGTMGPFGDWQLWTEGVCGEGRLVLKRRWQDDGYDIEGEEGEDLGRCEEVFGHEQDVEVCDLWIASAMFRSSYRCTSSVCGV